MSDHEPLDDDQIESLISGAATPDGHEDVAALFERLRAMRGRDVRVGPSLSEFVSGAASPPTGPPSIDDIVLEPVAAAQPTPAASRPGGLLRSPLARAAAAVTVVVAGLTGAHAAGLVDVPLLPDDSDSVEVVFAESPEPDPASNGAGAAVEATPPVAQSDEQTTAEPEVSVTTAVDDELRLELQVAGISASITVTNDSDGEPRVSIDVEGVGAGCEAAIERLDPLGDAGAMQDSLEAIEEACATELAGLESLLADPEALERLLEGMEITVELPEGLRQELDQLLADLDDLDLDQLFADLDGLDLDQLFADLDGLDLDQLFADLDGLDLDQLLPEGVEPGGSGGGFGVDADLRGLIEELLQLDSTLLDELLDPHRDDPGG